MASDVTFQLDPKGGEEILQNMAMATITQSAKAIATRAQTMAASVSAEPPEIEVTTHVGTIRRGVRAIATVKAIGKNAHQNYIGHSVLLKSKDAGRVN